MCALRSKPVGFPKRPFTTENFAPDGGGIDFLGLRLVNLRLLGEHLIPGLNNATGDLGAFFIASWIPWKFRQLAKTQTTFTSGGYRRFRQGIEVALAWCDREDSPSSAAFGKPFRGIGSQQNEHLAFPNRLTFEEFKRTDATSLFAAPLYGPALRGLRLQTDVWLGEGGKFTDIPIVGTDPCTTSIVEWVDGNVSKCSRASEVVSLSPSASDAELLDLLGEAGLHRKHARTSSPSLKQEFAAHLLSANDPSGLGRLRTAQLVLATLEVTGSINSVELRNVWLTGHLTNGAQLSFETLEVEGQRRKWSVFEARQLQRFAVELFLQLFEGALETGVDSIAEAVSHALDQWSAAPGSFDAAVKVQATCLGVTGDVKELSVAWNAQIHPDHPSFDWTVEEEGAERAFVFLARWELRARAWRDDPSVRADLNEGGSDRVGAIWFLNWLDERRHRPLDEFLNDLFRDLVFAQHLRIALGRFDRNRQKLRFLLSDNGIELTGNARAKPAPNPVIMADRLDAFLSLLSDLSILTIESNGSLNPGPLSSHLCK